MERCWLKSAVGDALHALNCAAGHRSSGHTPRFFGLLLAAILRWLGTSPSSAGRGNPFVAVVGLAVDGRSTRVLTQN